MTNELIKFGVLVDSLVQVQELYKNLDVGDQTWFKPTGEVVSIEEYQCFAKGRESIYGVRSDTREYQSQVGVLLQWMLVQAPAKARLATFIYARYASSRTVKEIVSIRFYM